MPHNARAVIFDLDDTLYPYRRFVLSGFAGVAAHLARWHRVNRRDAFRRLARAMRGADRGRELQVCLDAFDLPYALVPELLDIIVWSQRPRLRLPPVTSRVLDELHRDGWRIGVLTNGRHRVQARKIAALGLAERVDAIVYATQHGTGAGKPDPAAFLEISRRLSVDPSRAVFVGDDEWCDVGGAMGAGMHAVRSFAYRDWPHATVAPSVIRTLAEVPRVARALLLEVSKRHAA